MYGAIVIHKRNEPPVKEYTLLLSDWTNENPDQVDRSLHNATDWYGRQPLWVAVESRNRDVSSVTATSNAHHLDTGARAQSLVE